MARLLVISNYSSMTKVNPEAEIFISLQQIGHEVVICTYPDSEYTPRFEAAGIRVIPWHPLKKGNPKEVRKIRSLLDEIQPDCLFLFNSKAIITGIQAAIGKDVQVILYRGYSANIHWWDPFAYSKFLHPRVDKIICNSIGVQRHIQRNSLFVKDKTITIHKGHKLEWYQNIKAHDRSNLPVKKDSVIFTCVANDRRMKGIKYLMDAINQLPAENKAAFVLIGKGLDQPKYTKRLTHTEARNRVHFLGYRKDALEYVAASDAFILTSTKGESITKAVLEAMGLGIPPVITDIEGNIELVEPEKNGIVVLSKNPNSIKEGILKMCQLSTQERHEMGKASQNRIATVLSHEHTVKLYDSLIAKLVKLS